jgi:putative flippase GtrA
MKKLWEKYREIIVYVIVGLLTTAVSYGVRLAILYPVAFALSLDLASTDPAIVAQVSVLRTVAQSLGWVAGVCFAFIPNKKWVFRNEEGGKRLWAQFGKFVASRIGTYFVELGLAVLLPMILVACGYQACTFILTVDADLLSGAISIVLVTVLNYVLSKLLVFKNKAK